MLTAAWASSGQSALQSAQEESRDGAAPRHPPQDHLILWTEKGFLPFGRGQSRSQKPPYPVDSLSSACSRRKILSRRWMMVKAHNDIKVSPPGTNAESCNTSRCTREDTIGMAAMSMTARLQAEVICTKKPSKQLKQGNSCLCPSTAPTLGRNRNIRGVNWKFFFPHRLRRIPRIQAVHS